MLVKTPYPLDMLWFTKDHRVLPIPTIQDDHLVAILNWMARLDGPALVVHWTYNHEDWGGYPSYDSTGGKGPESPKSLLEVYRGCWRSYDNILAEARKRAFPIPPELPTEENPRWA